MVVTEWISNLRWIKTIRRFGVDNNNSGKYKIYVVTAPFENFDSGDSDYADGVIKFFPGSMSLYCKPDWNSLRINRINFAFKFKKILEQDGGFCEIASKNNEESEGESKYILVKGYNKKKHGQSKSYYGFYNEAYYDVGEKCQYKDYKERNLGNIMIEHKKQIRDNR